MQKGLRTGELEEEDEEGVIASVHRVDLSVLKRVLKLLFKAQADLTFRTATVKLSAVLLWYSLTSTSEEFAPHRYLPIHCSQRKGVN
jgi:hypothetical protein